jgi:hypothetical protein
MAAVGVKLANQDGRFVLGCPDDQAASEETEEVEAVETKPAKAKEPANNAGAEEEKKSEEPQEEKKKDDKNDDDI